MEKLWATVSCVYLRTDKQRDRHADRQTTDRQTDRANVLYSNYYVVVFRFVFRV